MKHSKLLSGILSAAIIFGSVLSLPAAGADEALTLKEGSRLTLDRDGGVVRGIYGEITVETLCDEFENSDITVSAGDRELTGSALVPSGAVVRSGEDELRTVIYGDVNSDGKITVGDAIIILKSVAGWDVSFELDTGDAAPDGKINVSDAIAVLKWVAGWDVMLGGAVYPAIDFELGDFSIVVPADMTAFEREAATLLCTAIDSVYGTDKGKDRMITDAGSASYEILVGNTSREKSKTAKKNLGEFDWSYDVQTKKSIVIAAGDDVGIYEAVKAFLWDSFGYINKFNRLGSYIKWTGSEYVTVEATKNVTAGTARTYTHETSCEKLELCGAPAEDFTVYSSNLDYGSADIMRRSIKKLCGKTVSVADISAYNGGKAIILKGDGDEHDPDVSMDTFVVSSSDDTIVIDAMTKNGSLFAVRAFSDIHLSSFNSTESSPDIADRKLYGVDSNLLDLRACGTVEYADGSVYKRLGYADAREMPVWAYLLIVPNGASRLVMGTPDGDTISGVSATVLEEMNSVKASGKDVLAGINADFFHIESDNTPQGLCVKDGKILRNNVENRPWIAVMKDGTLDCGIAGEARAKISNMQTGFGASHVLLKRGSIYQDGQGSSFGEIRHPRTALGYDGDGNLYMIVVDGRQQEISNGASLLDLSLMLKELGATYAVNLDGGGSSTMIIDNDGEFEVVNSPSDGSLRKVFNSVIITK